METAQLPFCLSLNPLLLQSPPLVLKPLIHFPQITSWIACSFLQGQRGFSPRRNINKTDTQMRWGRGEERGKMSLWMLETKALWQGNTLAVKHFAAPTLTVTGCIAHTWCTQTHFLSEKKVVLLQHQCEQQGGHTRTRYHDNPSQSRLLSWRYESLPRTCENRHQTRTNKPHRKFFPRRRNWEKKKKNGVRKRKATEV